jgi:peptide/nickel transport system substrate-binding protein
MIVGTISLPMRRFWRRAALAAVTAATLAGAAAPGRADDLYGPKAANPVMGGTLTFGSLVEPPGLDPYHQAADARIRFTVLVYQGLFYESPTGEAMPLLATGYELSPDGLVYTIKIRQGVKFHTGQVMTAKDVAYSYNYLRDPKNGSPGAGDLSLIQSVEAPDDETVRITLSKPNAALPMTLGNKYGGVVPAGYFDAQGAQQAMNQKSVGTGPFKLAEFRPNSNLTLVRNEDYWEKGAPYLDRINILFVPNSASLIVALRNKRVDLALFTRPQDIKQVEKAPGLVLERWPSLNQKALDLGSELAPLDDVRVRQAIALSIDKDEIMRAAVGGYGQVIGTMVAAMQDRWGAPLDALPNQKVDIEKAKQLLAEAGHSNLNLTLTTINGYDWMDPAAVTMKQELAKAGINLNIQRVDLGVWIKNFQSKNMGFTFNDWATQPDPHLLFYRHFHKAPEGADFRNWKNDKASALLDQGFAETDPEKRKAIYVDFQKVLAEDAPTVMLFSADHVTVRNEAVENYKQHPTGWYYGLARTYLKK